MRAGASRAAARLLALSLLPWLPMPVPAALLLWTGPLCWSSGSRVAAAMLATVSGGAPLDAAGRIRRRSAPALLAAG